MAYSSIGHMGYALIGLAAGTAVGVRGVLIYLITYVFMNARHLRLHHRDAPARPHAGADRRPRAASRAPIRRWRWPLRCSCSAWPASRRSPGFWGKYFIFPAAVQSGLWTLAVIGVLTSVVGAYYYIRIVKVMYFDAPDEAFDPRPASLSFVAAASGAVHHVLLRVSRPHSWPRRKRRRRCCSDEASWVRMRFRPVDGG